MLDNDTRDIIDTYDYLKLKELEEKAKYIVAIKTAIGHEIDVAKNLGARAKRKKAEIYALLSPHRLRGYLLVEFGLNYQQIEDMLNDPQHHDQVLEELEDPTLIANDDSVVGRVIRDRLSSLLKGLKHARAVVSGITDIKEIEHFLSPPPAVSGIEVGDIIEIINGPFKGEKAKVSKKDESKEEITVELFEAMVSIPVTIKGESVRVIEKETK